MEVVLETVQRICLEILVDLFHYGLLFGLVVFLSACHAEEYLNSAIVCGDISTKEMSIQGNLLAVKA